MLRSLSCFLLCSFLCNPALLAQDDITQWTMDDFPAATGFVAGGGAAAISLQGNTAVNGDLDVSGEVTPSGVRYPDGSLQVTAGGGSASLGLTANAGLYDNTIADISPPEAYTEICFKNGEIEFDIHAGGDPTAGGNCEPGDTGWIMERFEREAGAAVLWNSARTQCLMDGMRLPEAFEWITACDMADILAISSMTDDWEWASNSVETVRVNRDHSSDVVSMAAPVYGGGSCAMGSYGAVAQSNNSRSDYIYRCVR